MNRLFVVNKPMFRSSNGYMGFIKHKYNTKKVGFSGTLDPFATGCLIVATGQYTKLFQYLSKTPKRYRATLWLGAHSPTLDIEKIDKIDNVPKYNLELIENVLNSFKGTLQYLPPKYCAKKIDGKAAYARMRSGEDVELAKIESTVYNIKLLNYNHPFLHFEADVSEGTYIRSLGNLIAEKLGCSGALSSLERIKEGKFFYENEKALDPMKYLSIPRNIYTGHEESLELGKKLKVDDFLQKEDGVYFVESSNFFSIIQIESSLVHYKLNRLEKFNPDFAIGL